MKKIIKYLSDDGEEFMDELECSKHEIVCRSFDSLFENIPERPKDCSFWNGEGYIQHNEKNLEYVITRYLKLIESEYGKHPWITETLKNGVFGENGVNPERAGRVISETAPPSISKLWHRFSCIDSNLREWGQPYFAHYFPGELVCLNT